eukprot:361423-Chlamydomonas_euryale.AAC.1
MPAVVAAAAAPQSQLRRCGSRPEGCSCVHSASVKGGGSCVHSARVKGGGSCVHSASVKGCGRVAVPGCPHLTKMQSCRLLAQGCRRSSLEARERCC